MLIQAMQVFVLILAIVLVAVVTIIWVRSANHRDVHKTLDCKFKKLLKKHADLKRNATMNKHERAAEMKKVKDSIAEIRKDFEKNVGNAGNAGNAGDSAGDLLNHSGDPDAHGSAADLLNHSGDPDAHGSVAARLNHSGDPDAHGSAAARLKHSSDPDAHGSAAALLKHSGDPDAHGSAAALLKHVETGGHLPTAKDGSVSVLKAGHIRAHPNSYDKKMPDGWGNGVHAWDIYANGNIGAGHEGDVKAFMSASGDVKVGKKLLIGNEDNSDPYFMQKIIEGPDKSSLRITINDNADESLQIWGDSCGSPGGCSGEGAKKHAFTAAGNVVHAGAVGVGTTDASLWGAKHGVHTNNPGKGWTHLPWKNGENYLTGTTRVRKGGLVLEDGDLTMKHGKIIRSGGRLHVHPQEMLYLLPKKGVHITKNWGASGDLNVQGTTKTNKLRIGDKWVMSGVGDAHANDDWLRLFHANGKGYRGGLAAGKLWTQDLTVGKMSGTTVNGPINLKGGKGATNPKNYQSHFPWSGDGRNYIRGDTTVDGDLSLNSRNAIRTGDKVDWLRIHGSKSNGTALFNSLSVNSNGGLAVGKWKRVPTGEIHATRKVCIGRTCIDEATLKAIIAKK